MPLIDHLWEALRRSRRSNNVQILAFFIGIVWSYTQKPTVVTLVSNLFQQKKQIRTNHPVAKQNHDESCAYHVHFDHLQRVVFSISVRYSVISCSTELIPWLIPWRVADSSAMSTQLSKHRAPGYHPFVKPMVTASHRSTQHQGFERPANIDPKW